MSLTSQYNLFIVIDAFIRINLYTFINKIILINNLVRYMGQQNSNPKQTLQATTPNPYFQANVQVDGILKLSSTPFTDCQQIKVQGETYFIQRTRMNLKQLLKSKNRLNKKLTQQQVSNIIRDISFTLANLEQKHQPYPLISLQNIHFCQGKFKLMPIKLIKNDIFQLAKQGIKQKNKELLPLSPEIILALRCHENSIEQNQILFKSNIFSLGMIMLEACTFKSFGDCYDTESYDILNAVINERIEEIEDRYSNEIAMLIANMLDYDMEERISPKDLSIWVSRLHEETQNSHILIDIPGQSQVVEGKQSKIIDRSYNKEFLKPSQPPQPLQSVIQSSRINLKNKVLSKLKKQKHSQQMPNQQQIIRLSKSKSKAFFLPQKPKQQFLPNPYLRENDIKCQERAKLSPVSNKYSYEYDLSPASRQKTQTKDQTSHGKYKYNIEDNIISDRQRKFYPRQSQVPKRVQKNNDDRLLRNYEYDGIASSRHKIRQLNLTPTKTHKNSNQDYQLYIRRVRETDLANRLPPQQENNRKNAKTQNYQHKSPKPELKKKHPNKQNESILYIQKQIERSKKILEEVKRTQQEEKQQNIFMF